jgi:hypothetical protein
MNRWNQTDGGLPAELEYLREPALALVDTDRQIVGCGQVDFGVLERAIREQTRGLSTKDAKLLRERHRSVLRRWLTEHEVSDERLVVGLRFVAMLLAESD